MTINCTSTECKATFICGSVWVHLVLKSVAVLIHKFFCMNIFDKIFSSVMSLKNLFITLMAQEFRILFFHFSTSTLKNLKEDHMNYVEVY